MNTADRITDRIVRAMMHNLEGDLMNPQNFSRPKPLAQFAGYVIREIKRDSRRHVRITGFDGARTLVFRACLNGDLDVYEEVTTPARIEVVREYIPAKAVMRQVMVPASTELKAVDIV